MTTRATLDVTTARTAMLVAAKTIEVRCEELPPVGPNDVLVKTLCTGISAGTEMTVYRGSAAQWNASRDPETGLFEPSGNPEWTYPMAYGYAAVSRVVARGDEVSDVAVDDLVYTYTPHTSARVVPVANVIRLPDLQDPRVGVLNSNINTAYNGVLDAHPNLGDVVVVSGLGVIGLIVVQLLKRLGLRVIAVDGIPQRRALAERFGADITLTPGRDVARRVRELTQNRGADIVIEVSGASPALNEAIRIVGYCGTVIAVSWYAGTFESLSLAGEFHHNRPRIIASQVGGLNPYLGPLWSLARRQEITGELMQSLDLEPLLTHERSIEDAAEAYEIVDSGPDDLVQMVLSYEGTESDA